MYYQGILINCQTKGLIFLMNVAPDGNICYFRRKSAALLPGGWGGGGCSIMYTSSSIANSQRMQTEIKVAL